MAKIAAEKARKDRQEHKNAQKRNAQSKADIDDTKENVMDDLLSALASSGPGNQRRRARKSGGAGMTGETRERRTNRKVFASLEDAMAS